MTDGRIEAPSVVLYASTPAMSLKLSTDVSRGAGLRESAFDDSVVEWGVTEELTDTAAVPLGSDPSLHATRRSAAAAQQANIP
jgi:hypothetical protein